MKSRSTWKGKTERKPQHLHLVQACIQHDSIQGRSLCISAVVEPSESLHALQIGIELDFELQTPVIF